MTCAKCGNFMRSVVVGKLCMRACASCGSRDIERGTIIHASRKGLVPSTGADAGFSTDRTMFLENVSHDHTLMTISDRKCPTCGTALRVWLQRTMMYAYLCPTCNKPVSV